MNVEALLEPVAGSDPCGDDLSFSREFDAIRESRRADDPTLAQGDWKKPLKAADWPGVVLQCEALLRQRGKDLRVAVWLADALARTDGFAGLADGLLLCARLCETWWDAGLHPRPDDGDPAPRVGSLDWLLGQVVAASRSSTVLRDGERGLTLADIDIADASPVRSGPDGAEPPLTAADVARVRAATSSDFLVANAAAVRRALDALSRLESAVDARLGADGPAFGAARKALEDASRSVARFVPGETGTVAETRPGEIAAEVAPPTGPVVPGALQTRAQALAQLRMVAEFFRRTEPHSPVGYLADKAAAWGEMPLHEWLRAVLKDQGSLAQIEELLGLPRPPE